MKDLPPTRPVYLLGESFGGLLATAVAAERPDLVDRLILVNPATSFPRSMWPTLGPLLPSVPTVPSDLLLCCVLHINQQVCTIRPRTSPQSPRHHGHSRLQLLEDLHSTRS